MPKARILRVRSQIRSVVLRVLVNVLVTGGAGYLGGAVTDLLLQRGCSVRVYDNLLYEDSYMKPIDFVLGDVRDEKKLTKHLQWADVVVWLAAIVGDKASQLNPELTLGVNEKSVKMLSDLFDGRIIFTSTCSVYGAQESAIDETAPLEPLSIYAVTKAKAEDHLKNKNAVVFRLGTLFGLSDNFSRVRFDLVVNTLTARAFLNGRITVYGGEQYRPLLHVRDAAQAIVDSAQGEHSGVFNLHSINLRVIDLAERLHKSFPELQIFRTDLRFQDDRTYQVSSDKARKTFGFSPRLSVEDGVSEIKRILEEGRIKNINSARYSNSEHLASALSSEPYIIDAEMPARL
jgi:nucleoside-diphosphate-sugar epimerase